MKKVKKPVWIVILCLSIVVVLGAVFYLFRYVTQKDIARVDVIPDVIPTVAATQEQAVTSDEPTQAPVEKKPVEAWGYKTAEPEELNVSFDELMAINPDIYAWIYIPNTNVDYPVARTATTAFIWSITCIGSISSRVRSIPRSRIRLIFTTE